MCQAFSVARVWSDFQLLAQLVCRAFSVARVSCVFGCSYVEHSQLIVCRALSVGMFSFPVC